MIDLHSHILPNIDDGSRSLEESIEIIKQAVSNGVTDIIVTPHFILGSSYNKEKKENKKEVIYPRRWASAIGPAMSELIDRLLKSSKHEEQSYNACAGILHKVKTIPKGAAEEVARKCIEINSCKYFTFKQMLKKMDVKELPEHSPGTLPNHENIRGKDYYK